MRVLVLLTIVLFAGCATTPPPAAHAPPPDKFSSALEAAQRRLDAMPPGPAKDAELARQLYWLGEMQKVNNETLKSLNETNRVLQPYVPQTDYGAASAQRLQDETNRQFDRLRDQVDREYERSIAPGTPGNPIQVEIVHP